ncbi:hypothetical protein Peur_040057 [Populus x canadensis]
MERFIRNVHHGFNLRPWQENKGSIFTSLREKNQKRKSSQRAQPLHDKFQLLFFLKRKSKFQSRLLSYHRRLGSRSTILGIRAIPEGHSHSTRCPFVL